MHSETAQFCWILIENIYMELIILCFIPHLLLTVTDQAVCLQRFSISQLSSVLRRLITAKQTPTMGLISQCHLLSWIRQILKVDDLSHQSRRPAFCLSNDCPVLYPAQCRSNSMACCKLYYLSQNDWTAKVTDGNREGWMEIFKCRIRHWYYRSSRIQKCVHETKRPRNVLIWTNIPHICR